MARDVGHTASFEVSPERNRLNALYDVGLLPSYVNGVPWPFRVRRKRTTTNIAIQKQYWRHRLWWHVPPGACYAYQFGNFYLHLSPVVSGRRLVVNTTRFSVPATDSQSQLYTWSVRFLPRDAYAQRGLCRRKTMPSVRPSVCLSHAGIQSTPLIILKLFSPSGSPTILVFFRIKQSWQYSEATP